MRMETSMNQKNRDVSMLAQIACWLDEEDVK